MSTVRSMHANESHETVEKEAEIAPSVGMECNDGENKNKKRKTSRQRSEVWDHFTKMNSVLADSKPKCLVIDEIDGALNDGKGAVEVIMKLNIASVQICGDDSVLNRKSNAEKENDPQGAQPVRKSSKKKEKTASLLRHVICICNDLYAALRPLRQVANLPFRAADRIGFDLPILAFVNYR
nr:chromosome transmission fidelity protein 18 homolog [Ipomoea batatas]